MAGIVLLIFYLALGGIAGAVLFANEDSWLKKLWLGGVVGMMLLMWSHVPFSFLMGFTFGSHILGMVLALLTVAGIVAGKALYTVNKGRVKGKIVIDFKRALVLPFSEYRTKFTRKDSIMLACVIPFMLLAVILLATHTLNYDDGAYYTGQCTYGDMNMHLGFITSIARQQNFPPTYSLMGGVEPLNYPFLCDTISASLLLFGSTLRTAYMVPMLFAFLLVYMGVWYLAEAILEKPGRTVLAYVFFLLDGGFGLIYFLDGTKETPENFTRIFTGWYKMPTNLVDSNVRWTNVIADMLLPQRATLFGWMCLFAVLYILYKAVFAEKKEYFLVAGVLAGMLPMIHTHSYFAAGLIAIPWIIVSCIRDKFSKKTLFGWLFFGIPALLISVPQLLIWTFNAVDGESFVRFVFNWSNSEAGDSWLWFWIKNLGLSFILLIPAFLTADKNKKLMYLGPTLIFVVAEFIVFQPNLYDNIKLFFVWYLFMAIMIADFLGVCWEKVKDWRGTKRAAVVVVAGILIFLMTVSGTLSIAREVYSSTRDNEKNEGPAYQLYNPANTAAAEWIEDNTAPDALFLCYNNHNNAIASLTGRNIYVGAGTFLYFHGVNYQDRQKLMRSMLTDSSAFEKNKEAAGIDYVYIGDYERSNLKESLITDYFRENYERVYNDKGIEIFRISKD
ncbi:MAG: hypothetical protein J6112_08595 [Clostridia bacterium]|nr:hypothetical protein [Clostridia bacterium]